MNVLTFECHEVSFHAAVAELRRATRRELRARAFHALQLFHADVPSLRTVNILRVVVLLVSNRTGELRLKN